MNRKRNVTIALTAATLSALLVYGIYMLQLRQIRFQETVAVVVPKRFIPAGEQVTADMVESLSIAKASYRPDMIVDAGEVIGMESVVPLGQREPLLAWKFDRYRLMPGKTESTFQIPKEYVLSVASGVRAGDKVFLYTTGKEAESRRLFAEAVTVASVRTSANVEIDDPDNPHLFAMAEGDLENMYAARRSANGAIDAVNLNLTEAQWLALDALCRAGERRLVIAFSSESLAIGNREEQP
ncbi:SAF domain-containing protein [Paenibacillus aurantiacus]|uniref:SAF domain-containing protein n=1 Tax=Paenibacillus aurantiacus TaxID=1936118 RepID=A0ABV5KV68_9BACL